MMHIGSESSAQTWPTLDGKPPIIIAHRGASAYLPDHTLEAYRHAVELGADYIEPDVVSTKDGVLIVRHEPNLKDTTDIASRPEFAAYQRTQTIDGKSETGWFANDLTYAQIQTLRAKQPMPQRDQQYNGLFNIASLEEVLQLRAALSQEFGRDIGVYPETKHPAWHAEQGLGFEQKLVDLLAQYQLNRQDAPVFIQSFELGNLSQLKRLTPIRLVYLLDGDAVAANGDVTTTVPYDFQLSGDTRTYADMLSDANLREIKQVATAIGPWKVYLQSYQTDANGIKTQLPTNDVVARAHQIGLQVVPFTFRSEEKYLTATEQGDPDAEYQRYFKLGVDGLFSDFTDHAVAARAQFAQSLE